MGLTLYKPLVRHYRFTTGIAAHPLMYVVVASHQACEYTYVHSENSCMTSELALFGNCV